jgi:hypothetical protein
MDELPVPKIDEPNAPSAPFVVVFFRRGDHLSARVRDVASQEQWIVSDADHLRALLEKPPYPRPAINRAADV